jgi:hypothetical protein
MVLAERAAQIAAEAADGQDHAAGVKQPQRLFLDRIERERGDLAIRQACHPAAEVHARPAESGLPGLQAAMMRAKIAGLRRSRPGRCSSLRIR